MKSIMMIGMSFLLTACLLPIIPMGKPGSNEYMLYREFSKIQGDVKAEMLSCGFPDDIPIQSNFSVKMDINQYVKSNLCMEKKGFRFSKKSFCQLHYVESATAATQNMCREWLKEYKR